MSQDTDSKNCSRLRTGFTLIELLVVIAIIAILAAILFPVFSRVRENARRTACQSNMKQLGTGILIYIQDHDDMFPITSHRTAAGFGARELATANTAARNPKSATTPAQKYDTAPDGDGPRNWETWMDFTFPYLKNLQLFDCPSRPQPWTNSEMVTIYNGLYGYNHTGYYFPHYAYNGILSDFNTGGTGVPVKMSVVNGATQKIFITHNHAWAFLYALPDSWHDSSLNPYPNPQDYKRQRAYAVWVHNDSQPTLFADGHAKVITRNKAGHYTCLDKIGLNSSGSYPGMMYERTTLDKNATDAANLGNGCGFWHPLMTPPA